MSNNTLREALAAEALQEIDALVNKVDILLNKADVLPSYFEDASNQVSDIIKRGVEADLTNAKSRLDATHKELSNSIEVQRKINRQLFAFSKSLEPKTPYKQIILLCLSSFFGAFTAVFLASII